MNDDIGPEFGWLAEVTTRGESCIDYERYLYVIGMRNSCKAFEIRDGELGVCERLDKDEFGLVVNELFDAL
jgi:hypothetical protein